MRPSQVTAALRSIASRIERSRRPDRSLVAADVRKILAAVSGTSGMTYLLFTSASGSALWTVPPDSDVSALKRAAGTYNDEDAWQKRGQDGTAYVFTDQELVKHFAEDNEDVSSTEDVQGLVDDYGAIDAKKAMDMLTGKLDGLTGLPTEPS